MTTKQQKKGVTVKLTNVRLSFPHLFEKDNFKRYSANFLVEPGTDADKAIRAAISAAARNMWGDNAKAKMEALVAKDEVCYRKGEVKQTQGGDVLDGYAGKMVLTGTSSVQPTLLNETRDKITEESGKLFSGAFVNAIVEIWPQNGPKYYGIRCQLQGVQHYKDGESFGGGRRASVDEFDDVPTSPDDGTGGGGPADDLF